MIYTTVFTTTENKLPKPIEYLEQITEQGLDGGQSTGRILACLPFHLFIRKDCGNPTPLNDSAKLF